MQNEFRDLIPLAELDDCQLEHSEQDLRGQPLLSHDGQSIGTVREMLVGPDRDRIAALVLSDGRTVPVEQVEFRDDAAYLMSDDDFAKRPQTGRGDERHIPIIEERMVVGKREVDSGGVRVRTHMEETPVEDSVMLRKEHVNVERRPVSGGRIDPSDSKGMMGDREYEVTATSEEPVIGKEARVKEELVISKSVDREKERVTGTERHTEVDIDKTSGSDSRRR